MRRTLALIMFCGSIMVFWASYTTTAQENSEALPPKTTCTAQVEVSGVIGPGTVDLLRRVDEYATNNNCSSILLLINTPGGGLDSTRLIVELILNSEHPYLCLVSPSGGHAGSAGAIILQACHVSGALFGTNLGAATPVAMGQEMPEDLRKKIMNDTRSWLESLTKLRGRSEKFGQDIILEAKAVTAEEALRLNAIDFAGSTKDEFLKFSEGRSTKMSESKEIQIRTGELREFALDMRYKVVSLLTDPQLAYMLLLGSLALLYFEITNPGTMIAGVAGGLGLVIALVALHKLDVEWGGVLLILLGIGLLISEMFIPSFGILGVGGITAFVLGSIFLFDPVKTGGYRLPLGLIIPVVIVFAAVFVGVSYLVLQSKGVRKKGGFDDLQGEAGRVRTLEEGCTTEGYVELWGELWRFRSNVPVQLGDRVVVRGNKGLVLEVEREVTNA